jgi:biotin transport system permease protein
VLTGAYLPGTSPVHRAPAGVKLGWLAVFLLVIAVTCSPVSVLLGTAVLTAAAALARVPPRAVGRQVRPVLLLAVVVAAFQLWTAGPATAGAVTGTLLLAVAAAGLITLTTRTEDLLDAVIAAVGPLRRFGVDPQRVGLVLALAVRSVPVLADLTRQVHEARVARGAGRSPRALLVPLVIRAVRHADRLGEALAARGVDDP